MDGSTTHMRRVRQQEVGGQHSGMDGSTTHMRRVKQQEVGDNIPERTGLPLT